MNRVAGAISDWLGRVYLEATLSGAFGRLKENFSTCLMNKFIAFFFALALGSNMHAQFGTAPDFTVTDIDGNTHSLYADILDQENCGGADRGHLVSPCWNLHTTGALQELHEAFGPDGTDQLRVIVYEADPTTTLSALNGTAGNTLGDWTAG